MLHETEHMMKIHFQQQCVQVTSLTFVTGTSVFLFFTAQELSSRYCSSLWLSRRPLSSTSGCRHQIKSHR